MTTKSLPQVKDALSLRARYVRAVNISRDLDDKHALDGYLLTDTVKQALARLARGLLASSTQRAWRVTGSYGTGKSAFGLFLARMFSEPVNKRALTGQLLADQAENLRAGIKKLPRYEILVIEAARGDASIAIANALLALLAQRRTSANQKALSSRLEKFVSGRLKGEASPSAVFQILSDTCAYLSAGANPSEGLLLLVDEMGRWLEFAADPEADLDASFFQSLAELCGGPVTDIPLSVVGFLHQRFEDYAATRRDRRLGQEWAKVAERFEDITFAQSLESTVQIIARAMEGDRALYKQYKIPARATALYRCAADMGLIDGRLTGERSDLVERLYPFHPTTLLSAVSLFRRFGQNERSTFSFLLSAEPFALQDFASRALLGRWYRVDDLCDWLLAHGTLRTFDEDRLKRWALLQDVLRAAPVYEEQELRCLKTVGLLNLLEPQAGLRVTREQIAFAIADDGDPTSVLSALNKLIEKTLLYVRPATQELCLWPQSSVNVASELARIKSSLPRLSRLGALTRCLPAPRPIVAHRHYFETGTLRMAQVHLLDDVQAAPDRCSALLAADGEILVVPCYPDQNSRAASQSLAELSANAPVGRLLAMRQITEQDLEIAEELVAWSQMERECAELRIDSYARSEVRQSIHRLKAMIVHRLADLRAPSQGSGHGVRWWHTGRELPIADGRQLNQQLSSVFDQRFASAPKIRNELINRTAVSTAAAAARQRLLERVFSQADIEDLGIELTPPEKAIYLSMFQKPGLHKKLKDRWAFQEPPGGSDWRPAWIALTDMLERSGLVTIREILDRLSQAPFGMRESVSLLLLAAYLSVHKSAVIVRERGTYLTQVESGHIARLIKRPEQFEIRMVRTQSAALTVFEIYREVLLPLSQGVDVSPTVADLTRLLYDWYLKLPEYTLSTAGLEAPHRATLALLSKASDPVELLTVAMPLTLGAWGAEQSIDAVSRVGIQLLRTKLKSFLHSVGGRLDALRIDVLKVIAEEVGVADFSVARTHIVSLAENASEDVVDYALKAFIQRSADGARNQAQWLDSLASLLGGRSIETWRDDTLMGFRIELRRVYNLLTRVVALAKLSGASGADHAAVAVHVVDHKGRERFVTVPADEKGMLLGERMDGLREALRAFPVPAYALARLLLEYSADLPAVPEGEIV